MVFVGIIGSYKNIINSFKHLISLTFGSNNHSEQVIAMIFMLKITLKHPL